jgi:hypothetical protein
MRAITRTFGCRHVPEDVAIEMHDGAVEEACIGGAASGIGALARAVCCRATGSGGMGGSEPGGLSAYYPKQRNESGGEPLQVDRGGDEEGLDAHIVETAADGAGETVPSLRLAVKPLRAPAVGLVKTSITPDLHHVPEHDSSAAIRGGCERDSRAR